MLNKIYDSLFRINTKGNKQNPHKDFSNHEKALVQSSLYSTSLLADMQLSNFGDLLSQNLFLHTYSWAIICSFNFIYNTTVSITSHCSDIIIDIHNTFSSILVRDFIT